MDSEQVDRLGPRWKFPATDEVAIYLMNDRGKTVDCLWPRPQEIDSDYEVVLEDGEAVLQPKGEENGNDPKAERSDLSFTLEKWLRAAQLGLLGASPPWNQRVTVPGNTEGDWSVEPIGFNAGHVSPETT